MPHSVNDVTAECDATIASEEGAILVSHAGDQPIRIYDSLGRLICQRLKGEENARLEMPASGAYLVQVGQKLAERVVVAK